MHRRAAEQVGCLNGKLGYEDLHLVPGVKLRIIPQIKGEAVMLVEGSLL